MPQCRKSLWLRLCTPPRPAAEILASPPRLTGASEVVIDNYSVLESQVMSAIHQRVLANVALLVVDELARRRLADIDNRDG